MNERIIKMGLESGMLNYVDNETPRHYFLSGHADEQDLAKFAQLIVAEMLKTCEEHPGWTGRMIGEQIKQHFGVEE